MFIQRKKKSVDLRFALGKLIYHSKVVSMSDFTKRVEICDKHSSIYVNRELVEP